MDKWVTIDKFCEETGKSKGTVYQSMSRKSWPPELFCKDGGVMVNITGYYQWLNMKASQKHLPAA